MEGIRPRFYTSKYFDAATWTLSDGAPTELLVEFKEYQEAHSNGGFEPDLEPLIINVSRKR